MKQILFTFMLAVCLLLCACGEATSIGIIGGSDGPTAIMVGEETEKEPIRMIRVGGKLYYDSDEESELVEGKAPHSELKQSAKEGEIPEGENSCNFAGAVGYRNDTDGTKDVLVEDEWVVFKLFDDPEQDLSQYKYCYYLKGRMPNAESDSEFVVLTADKDMNFAKLTERFFSSLYTDSRKPTTFCLYNESAGSVSVNLTAKDVTSKGMTIECVQYGGSPDALRTTDWFSIEEEKGGEWLPVEKKLEDTSVSWNSISYTISQDKEWTVDWEWLYGELPAGSYRLVKELIDTSNTEKAEMDLGYIYFEIQ